VESLASNFLKFRQGQVRPQIRYAVILGSTGGLLIIAQAWLLAQVINAVIFNTASLASVMPWLWSMIGIILLRTGVIYASERVAFNAAARIRQKLRMELYTRIQQLGPAYLGNERTGEITTIITEGVEALENYYARYLPAMSLAVWIPLSILAFIIPIDWESALIFLFTAPLIPVFMVFIGKGAEKLNQQQWQKLTRMGGHFLDVIQGLTTLKLFNASRQEAEVIERVSEDYRQATMKVLRLAFLSSLALEFLATISIAMVAVTIGFRLLFGELDFLSGFFVLLLAPEFYLPLRSLGTHYHARMEAIAASEKILDILDEPLPLQNHIRKRFTGNPFPVRLENIHVRYDNRDALCGFNLDIRAGERLALVGPSGAGKSTVVNLLLGFVQPVNGRVTVNGTPLTDIEPASWRHWLAWVPQRPRLFHGTVAYNLSLGLNGTTPERLWRALEMAHADTFVKQLPQGIDTLIGEGGQALSGGQVQRLALARALVRDIKLLIMDEPTAHLDPENEQLIRQTINKLSRDITVISIAHRIETIEQADRIIVLNQGIVEQQGTHRELIVQDGLYAELVNIHRMSTPERE
jgi:ATP-binding cassette subfamily C protein CydD